MKIREIDGKYYIFRTNTGKVTMTVRQYRYDGRFERSDTGLTGDKYVPEDIQKAILKFQQKDEVKL